MMSPTLSRPIERRTRSGVSPDSFCCSSRKLGMRGARRMEGKGLRVAHVGEVGEKLKTFDELLARGLPALYPENDHSAEALLEESRGDGVGGVCLQARVADPRGLRMLSEALGHGQGVLGMPRHPDVQGLESLEEDPGVVGREAGADVAQRHGSVAKREGDLAQFGRKVDGPAQSVVVLVRLGKERELGIGPVEAARRR